MRRRWLIFRSKTINPWGLVLNILLLLFKLIFIFNFGYHFLKKKLCKNKKWLQKLTGKSKLGERKGEIEQNRKTKRQNKLHKLNKIRVVWTNSGKDVSHFISWLSNVSNGSGDGDTKKLEFYRYICSCVIVVYVYIDIHGMLQSVILNALWVNTPLLYSLILLYRLTRFLWRLIIIHRHF